MHLENVRIQLHEDCVKFGGRDEYPDGWMGVEMPPQGGDSADVVEAYKASAPYQGEGLRYIRFAKPFIVPVEYKTKDGKKETKLVAKTDKRYGMWIPYALVRPATTHVSKTVN